MQKLLANFDLNEENDVMMGGMTVLRSVSRDPEPIANGAEDSAISADLECHEESHETTLDNTDDPLELTSEECDDSGDAGDEASSDEQQQSRSLSLSYSLSISHAQENFSQYSQSTDKGLSKRYDSPCSYEDDRESECTNFDKLDDWNDFINDMQNNNNGENANRDFREYYDEYLASKGQTGSSSSGVGTNAVETNDECINQEMQSGSEETATSKKERISFFIDKSSDIRPDTPAFTQQASATEKCRTFLEYRNPTCELDDDPMDDNSNSLTAEGAEMVNSQLSGKRKFCYTDREEIEYEVTKLITEKYQKTDIVPDHGSHPPIMDDERFARLTQVDSLSKTSVREVHGHSDNNHHDFTEEAADDKLVVLDGEEEESFIATTPTNPRNMQQMFRSFASDTPTCQVLSATTSSIAHIRLNPNQGLTS